MKCIDRNIYIIRHILECRKHIESMYVINKCRQLVKYSLKMVVTA